MKRGFGLLEVLVAAVVLAFLLVGLNIMQKGNREAVLRIRSRDAAQTIAQDFLDSLSKLGVSSIHTGDTIKRVVLYEWEGQNNIIASLTYTIDATITADPAHKQVERSEFTKATSADSVHTISKNIDLKVSWPFKNSTQSISMSRIVK